LKKESYGSTFKAINKEVLTKFQIPLPPLEEQKAIAGILSTVQSAIEKTEKVINALKNLKKSMMKHLFTYGPVAEEEAEKVELKETEIGLIPKHWEVMRLGEVAEIIMGQSPPGETYNTQGVGMPFLQGKAEFGKVYPSPVKYTTNPLKIGKTGSVLISVRAPVGDVNIANKDYCIGRGLASISFKNGYGYNEYLFYCLQFLKPLLEKEGYGSTFKAINKEVLTKFQIPLPPLEEQQKIAQILQSIDQRIEKEEKYKNALQNLFKSLLHNLMTGKIRVRVKSMGRINEYNAVQKPTLTYLAQEKAQYGEESYLLGYEIITKHQKDKLNQLRTTERDAILKKIFFEKVKELNPFLSDSEVEKLYNELNQLSANILGNKTAWEYLKGLGAST
jgi:restriction endonuclease S subunit